MKHGIPAAGAALLVVLCACSRPKADPWPSRVGTALARQSAPLTGTEREDFEAGFSNGAAMVHEALKAGIAPYRPVLNLPPAPPRRIGPLPEGAALEVPPPAPELDPGTGLWIVPAGGGGNGAFARGQAQGFDWALGAIGGSLARPLARPAPPTEWTAWEELKTDPTLVDGRRTVEVRWAPGLLAWDVQERGFPDLRRWRPWGGDAAPSWVALASGVLWAETREGKILAIDLASGGILEVRPAPVHPAREKSDWEKEQEAVAREFRSPAFREELARLRRQADSGQVPDLLAVARRLAGMGDEAEQEAFTWFLKAAEKGDPGAMLFVGTALFHGRHVPPDKAAAAQWLDRAIRAGQPEAEAVKGMLFPR